MENQNSATKFMLKYGAFLALSTIIIGLLNYSFGNIYKPHWIINLLNFLLMVAFIVLAIKAFKDSNNGFLKFGEALKIGLGVALISTLINIIYFYVFVYVIEPDFMTRMSEFQQQMMYEKFPDMPEEQLEVALEMNKKFSTPLAISLLLIVWGLFIGLIVSLITGAVMKKEESVL